MAKHPNAKVADEDYAPAIAAASTVSDALRALGIPTDGHYARELLRRAKRLGIGTAHLRNVQITPPPAGARRGRVPASQRLVRLPSDAPRTSALRLRRALIESGSEYHCAIAGCPVEGVWLGETLVLQVDHIDGDSRNNLIENLRFLCPNCHTQTANHSGKKNKKHYFCSTCNAEVSKGGRSGRCVCCAAKDRRKADWPSDDDLRVMLATSNFVQVGKALGVSDNAVRKHLAAREAGQAAKGPHPPA